VLDVHEIMEFRLEEMVMGEFCNLNENVSRLMFLPNPWALVPRPPGAAKS
jgi:hypothetical protein